MIKLIMNGDTQWSLCRISDSVLYKKEYKKRRNIKADWLSNVTSPEEIERISLSRAKSRIKELALNNDFEYFGTITVGSFACNRFALEDCQDLIRKNCRRLKRKNIDFKYLFITEKHKDGAFHFHGLFKCFPKDDLYINKYGYYNSHIFDSMCKINSFEPIKDYVACCHYITKYITKDCIKNDNNQVYFCSKGLKSANYEYMIDYDLEKIFPNKKIFQNEYCQKVDFDLSRLNSEHAKNLNNYFYLNDEILQNDNNYITNYIKLLTSMTSKFKIKL